MTNHLGGDNVGINIQGSKVEHATITNTVVIQRPEGRPVPAELPRRPSLFIGRAAELARIEKLAEQVGTESVVVVVEGAPGVGKTGLLQHAAHTLAPRFPDGHLYVDLRCYAPGTSPVTAHEVLGRFLTSLGVPRAEIPAGTDERAARFRTEVASSRLLMVLDNAGDPAVVRDLLPGGAHSMVLIGSRQQLASLESSARIPLPVLGEEESAELVTGLVGERAESEPAATRELARLCGNLPLALWIACARLVSRPAWSVRRLVTALSEERRRLAGLQVGDLEIRAAFSLSYRALDPLFARVFRIAGLHPGPDWTAEAMADTAELELAEAEDALDGLLSAHLVEQDVAGRFRLHDLVKLFARERAEETDGDDAVRAGERRLVDHFVKQALRCDLSLRDEMLLVPNDRLQSQRSTALDWFDAELGNCSEVLRLAAEREWFAEASVLSGALSEYLRLRGLQDVMEAVCRINLKAARARGDLHQQVRALGQLASLELDRRNPDRAAELFSRARELSRRIGDEDLEILVIGTEATLYTVQGRLDAAAKAFERCLVHHVRRDDFNAALHNLGNVLAKSERWDEAIAAYRMCEKLASALEPRVLPTIYQNLANLLHDRGTDPETALEYARRARDFCAERGDHPGKAAAQLVLGRIQLRSGHVEDAAETFADVRRLSGTMRNARMEANAIDGLVMAASSAVPSPVRTNQ